MKHFFGKILSASSFIVLSFSFSFAQATREKGIELYENGDYKAAIEILQKIVEADANDGEARRFLAMSFAGTGDKKQAREVFKKGDHITDKDLNRNYDSPVKITVKRFARATERARRNGVSGSVRLAVEFRSDGKIGLIFPLNELPDGLTESAIKAASGFEFEPAIKNGKALTVIKFVEYHFSFY